MENYDQNHTLTVINFFGGPGVGKSTTAAGLFYEMKKRGMSVEYVQEYCKSWVYEGRNMFTEQDYIFAKQNNRLRTLVGKVQYAITDSPIVMGLFYMPIRFPTSLQPLIEETFHTYTNINILLNRVDTQSYQTEGRNETIEESISKHMDMEQYLTKKLIHHNVDSGPTAAVDVLKIVQQLQVL